MLVEIWQYTDSVPNFRNNMDLQGHSMFRKDSIELQGYLHKLTYALLMYGSPKEDKSCWKAEFDKYLAELKEFIDTRKKENWSGNSDYTYQFNSTGW